MPLPVIQTPGVYQWRRYRFPFHLGGAFLSRRRGAVSHPFSLRNVSASQFGTLASLSPPSSEIIRIREALVSREKTAVEIAGEYLDRLQRTELRLRCFLHVAAEAALREAENLDRRIDSGKEIGELAGVVIAVKDNLCTAGMPSTAGSRILEGYRPPFDATAVKRLRERGAIVIGKTNMDEFGMGSSTEASAFQATLNPWDTSRVPGGSSGGSAASVAARQCVASLGSDTGGSVRQPASFCGVVGIKPTYGRVSRFGLMAYASSLDVVGCFGSSVADTAILLQTISGHDKLDATTSKHDVPHYVSELQPTSTLGSKPLKGLKVGMITETLGEGVDSNVVSLVKHAASHLEDLGAAVSEVSLPCFDLGLPAYYILASSEASSNLSRYDGVRYGSQVLSDELNSLYGYSRANGFGPEVKRRILMGTYALSAGYFDAYYKRAQKVRTLVQKSFKAALDENNILISPAAPTIAYKIGEKANDPLAMYAGDVMTVNVNLAGLPALVLPCGLVDVDHVNLPVGLQMIGSGFGEGELLRVGHIFEQTLQRSQFCPPLSAYN